MLKYWCRYAVLWGLAVVLCGSTVRAQGLPQLPGDGTWVRYDGTYVVEQPGAEPAAARKQYTQRITISSVGQEMVEGEPARWIEIKVETSREGADSVEQGKYGLKLFKVLVRERDVRLGQRPYLPVVRGYRRYGQGEVEPLSSGLLRFCPTITLLDQYPDLREVGTEEIASGLGRLACMRLEGSRSREGNDARSRNEGELWISEEAPFGLVRWRATLSLEVSRFVDGQTRVLPESTLSTELTAAESGQGAVSELPNAT